MKRTSSAVALAVLASAALADAQAPKPPDVRMLSGCVAPSATSKRQFTLTDAESTETYRLTGTDVREFVGKHVEVLGAPSKRLVIKGGLYPSPNVAGQAGDIDPGRAAIAAQAGPTSNEQRPLIEFRVRSVRLTPGDCPKE